MNFNYHRVALRIDKWRRRPKRQGRDTSQAATDPHRILSVVRLRLRTLKPNGALVDVL